MLAVHFRLFDFGNGLESSSTNDRLPLQRIVADWQSRGLDARWLRRDKFLLPETTGCICRSRTAADALLSLVTRTLASLRNAGT